MILEQFLVTLPLVLGAYITFSLLKLPDFAIEGSYLFGAVFAYLARDFPLPVVLLCALLGGVFSGALVASLNQLVKLPFLLAAIITNGLIHGATQYLLGTSMVPFHLEIFSETLFFGCIAIVAVGVLAYKFSSQMGYCFAIYGNNPQFFSHHRTSGVFVLYFGVIVGHMMAALGGFLFALSNGFVDLQMNYGVLLLCITALFFGKTLLVKDKPTILVPIAGLIAYFLLQQTLLRLGLNLKYFYAFQALAILAVLLFPRGKTIDHLGV